MEFVSSKVSRPFVNNEGDQPMEEGLPSKGSGCSGQNKGKRCNAKLSEDDRRERKRLADRKYRLENRRELERMTEEFERLKETISLMQSNQQLSVPILEKLQSYLFQSTSQQHDINAVSVQIEYLQDIRQLSAEARQLKEEIGRLSIENGLLKEKTGQLSAENGHLKEETGRLSIENRHLKEENNRLNLENKFLSDDIKGLRGKSQLLEVMQGPVSHISQPTCQNNRCKENFDKEAVVGMELERMTSKNSLLKSDFGRLTDEIRQLQEDITWLRPNWHFPVLDLNELGETFFQSTSQQHDDDKSASVQSCGFQLLEGIQNVEKAGSSDAATNQNHT